jgi:hypothetical protein
MDTGNVSYHLSDVFIVIDDGSLTDDMLYEIINNLTKSEEDTLNSSTDAEKDGKQSCFPCSSFQCNFLFLVDGNE